MRVGDPKTVYFILYYKDRSRWRCAVSEWMRMRVSSLPVLYMLNLMTMDGCMDGNLLLVHAKNFKRIFRILFSPHGLVSLGEGVRQTRRTKPRGTLYCLIPGCGIRSHIHRSPARHIVNTLDYHMRPFKSDSTISWDTYQTSH